MIDIDLDAQILDFFDDAKAEEPILLRPPRSSPPIETDCRACRRILSFLGEDATISLGPANDAGRDRIAQKVVDIIEDEAKRRVVGTAGAL